MAKNMLGRGDNRFRERVIVPQIVRKMKLEKG